MVPLRCGRPIADPRLLLELARTHLERDLPAHPIAGFRVTARSLATLADPNEPLFPEPRRDRAAREVALTRLTGRFGDVLRRATRIELASPAARAGWTEGAPYTGPAAPWRAQDPPSPLRGDHVEVAGRRRRVTRFGRIERALAPFWLTGALRVERLAWVEVDGPLLVMLRARQRTWEAVAWVD